MTIRWEAACRPSDNTDRCSTKPPRRQRSPSAPDQLIVARVRDVSLLLAWGSVRGGKCLFGAHVPAMRERWTKTVGPKCQKTERAELSQTDDQSGARSRVGPAGFRLSARTPVLNSAVQFWASLIQSSYEQYFRPWNIDRSCFLPAKCRELRAKGMGRG